MSRDKITHKQSIGKYVNHVNNAARDIIDQYEKRKEMRKAGTENHSDYEKANKRIARRERGIKFAANALEKYMKKNHMKEDAPVNNVGGGAIAGAGVGQMGEPGVSTKAQRKHSRGGTTPTSVILGMLRRKAPNPLAEETFAGAVVFEVSSSTFHNAKMEKRKGKHWRTYLDEYEELTKIREDANRKPGKPIVLRNRTTTEMVFVRYGKAR